MCDCKKVNFGAGIQMLVRPIGATSDAESFALIIAWLNGIDFANDDGAKTRALGTLHRSIFAAPFDGLNLHNHPDFVALDLTFRHRNNERWARLK
jgi:hypothetical protein